MEHDIATHYKQNLLLHNCYVPRRSNMSTQSSPAIEIAKFLVNDAYKKDPTILNEAFANVRKAPGVQSYVLLRLLS